MIPRPRSTAFGPDDLETATPRPSRVHELGRMKYPDLVALFVSYCPQFAVIPRFSSRDQVISVIREQEERQERRKIDGDLLPPDNL